MDAEQTTLTCLNPFCLTPIIKSKTRPRLYCSDACRKKAKREQQKKPFTSKPPKRRSSLVNRLKSNEPVIKTETIIGVSGTVHRVPVGATGIEQAPTLVQKERSARQTFEEVKRLLDGYYD